MMTGTLRKHILVTFFILVVYKVVADVLRGPTSRAKNSYELSHVYDQRHLQRPNFTKEQKKTAIPYEVKTKSSITDMNDADLAGDIESGTASNMTIKRRKCGFSLSRRLLCPLPMTKTPENW